MEKITERKIRALITLCSHDPVYICRAVNKTQPSSGLRERGVHSGQLYGVFRDGACYYEYGGKGFRAPDIYTGNLKC